MPLARYFFLVGGVLLALLLISDACLPRLRVADRINAEPPVIRIHSDRKWPERIVYDTSLPTIVLPAQIANADADIPAAAPVVDVSKAFAQMQPSDVKQLQQSEPKALKQTTQHNSTIVKRRARRPVVLVARHPQFDWFGNSIW